VISYRRTDNGIGLVDFAEGAGYPVTQSNRSHIHYVKVKIWACDDELPLLNAVTDPTKSSVDVPTNELAGPTTPDMPEAPSPKVTAPALSTPPLAQNELSMT
jgi:hypothetical protein